MENYIAAAQSRLDDLHQLMNGKRKVGSIHLGGIYIECLLKGMICMGHTVTDSSGISKWIVDGNEMSRPCHVLCSPVHRQLLGSLYDDMPSDISHALNYIQRPEGINYIDYRYIPEESIEEEKYDYWTEQFISVFLYLERKKHEI